MLVLVIFYGVDIKSTNILDYFMSTNLNILFFLTLNRQKAT